MSGVSEILNTNFWLPWALFVLAPSPPSSLVILFFAIPDERFQKTKMKPESPSKSDQRFQNRCQLQFPRLLNITLEVGGAWVDTREIERKILLLEGVAEVPLGINIAPAGNRQGIPEN